MTTEHIKVLYWNIHCINSRTVGEKQKDPKFLEIISQCDIICISELHTTKDLSIQGFSVKKQKFRKKNHKGPKISVGLAVYTRRNISGNFQVVPNDNTDSIWLKTTPRAGKEVNLGFFYCSPESKKHHNTWEIVEKEIERHSQDTTYIFGDFNARTRTECENVLRDKHDEELGVPTNMSVDDMPLPRNSEDQKLVTD